MLGEELSAVHDEIRDTATGLANPASTGRFRTPTGNAGIHEISSAPRSASTTAARMKFRGFQDSSWEYGTDQWRPGLPTRSQCREFLRERQKAPHRANLPSPLAWVFGSGIIRPETNAPHWVQRAGFGRPLIASAQKVMFHGGDVREFGVSAR